MSKFIVSARKYRPTTFEDVVGQEHVADTLKNALQSEKLAHSFLFCGPRGVGKTTCARILAKVINCQNPIDKTEPCNECNSCLAFNDTASFNIIELDAASNNSVDNIRNLIDQVRIPPQQGKYKVFIIDEVHMLSTAAFNAFLKTLEEPPPYAIFILATTEKHKILPTILSRCQIFDFKRIQVKDISIQLTQICKQENISAEPEALHLIGQKADGAMRDALSIFDKVASSGGSNLTYKSVIENLNILDYDYYFRVVDAFLQEDLSQVLLIVDEIMMQGFDVDQFIQGLGSHMRDLLVCKDARTLKLLDVSGGLKNRYSDQAKYATKAMLLTGLNVLNQCDIALPRATNKRLYAEIALSKINFSQRTIESVLEAGGEIGEKKTKLVTYNPNPKDEIGSQERNKDDETKMNSEVSEKSDLKQESNEKSLSTDIELDLSPTQKSSKTEYFSNQKEIQSEKKNSSLDLSLDSLLAAVDKESAALDQAKERFGIEAIKEIWKNYTEQNPSPSVQAALRRVQLRVINFEELEITVPNGMTGEIILAESPLIEKIRTDLGSPTLIFIINIAPKEFPDFEEKKSPTSLKPKEKYQLLLGKKPELKKLIDDLEMIPDNDVSLS